MRVSLVPLSRCPVAGLAWKRPAGAWTLTVVCRATFVLLPGTSSLATVQHLPVVGDRAFPSPSSPALYAPSDLVPMKPRVDVIVVGRPRGAARVRLAVAEIDKRVERPDVDLGPIAAAAPSRARLLGAMSAGARRPDDWDGRVVPDDLDPGFFNVAPHDQQLAALRGDEHLLLENLHPQHAELVTQLPSLRPLALAEAPGSVPRHIAMQADTLWIDALRGIGALVWRGQVALDLGPAIRVMVDVVGAETGLGAAVAEAPRSVPARASFLQETVGLSSGPSPVVPAALPFAAGGAAPLRAPAPLPPDSETVSPWARGRVVAPRHDDPPPERVAIADVVATAPARPPVETLELLWFDPTSASRVRREPRFEPLLAASEISPLDPFLDPPEDGDLADREDRRDLFEILARAEPLAAGATVRALGHAVADGGVLVEPVVMIAGELSIAFDALATLKAMISAAARVAGLDANTASLRALGQELLGAPAADCAPTAAAGLAERIRAAAVAALPERERPAALDDLDADVKRGLLDARSFRRIAVLGAPHVVSRFRSAASPDAEPLDAYLPEALVRKLPRAETLRVRALASVHPDVRGGHASVVVRPLAMAIVTPAPA